MRWRLAALPTELPESITAVKLLWTCFWRSSGVCRFSSLMCDCSNAK